jgi:hypothetical protein
MGCWALAVLIGRLWNEARLGPDKRLPSLYSKNRYPEKNG